MLRDTPLEADIDPDRPYVLPAAFAQQRLWFLNQLEPYGAAAYNVPLTTRLRGTLDVDALEQAFGALVARHEPFRTSFQVVDGVPHQLIDPDGSVSVELLDLSDEGDPEQAAHASVEEAATEPFDLAVGPLLRVRLLRLGAEEHILVIVAHHTVIDGWSTGILNRELSELYAASLEGREPELAELQIQYGDYAAWQQDWIASGGLDLQLAYWKDKLGGAPALLELPTDRPRPSRQSFRGGIVRKQLPLELLERVKALGEREGATLFMTLLAANTALLARYSGQDDIVVASPIANRNRLELEGMIGFLANTIALRTTLEDDPTFTQLLRRVRETALDGFSNQDTPFDKLVEELNPERHLGHNPIAQVLFAVQPAPARNTTLLGLPAERFVHGKTTAKFDLSMFASPTPDGLLLSLEYAADLFDESSAQRILEHLATLLDAAVTDPDRAVTTLPLLTEPEREQILYGFNDTTVPYALRCVHELVAEQARRTPEAVAVAYGDDELTYGELERRANRLAHRLAELGVGPNVPVAIAAERSVELVTAVLAILKAGGAYVPVDPAYPPERQAFMLTDAGVPVVLTQARLAADLPEHSAQVVCLDVDLDLERFPAEEPPRSGVGLDDLAYVIYTSGSTGRPKGVAMGHRPLANLITWQLENFSPPGPARTLQFASLSFDVAFQELFSTLCSGGALQLLTEGDRRDPQALLQLLRTKQVQRLFIPFVGLQSLCETAEQQELSVPDLREVMTAGEQLKATPSIRRFFARHPDCRLTNQYGPTESHVVTTLPLDERPDLWPALPPIGRPIANAKVHVLDRHLQPVPVGVAGELCLGGVAVAQGYLHRPELTDERFVPDPFSQEPGSRLYRTGDLARYHADGVVEFLGRFDHQFKVRGYRIEPGEVEEALRKHPQVREALVVARADGGGEGQLVAYVVGSNPAPAASELRDLLQRSLPEYMVPSAFVALEAFPLNPNGKVDRPALPAPDLDARATSDYAAPTDELEQQLAALWMELLEVDRVGVDDDFFALGGHSLLAVRLVQRVQDDLKRSCTLSMLFRNRTIRGLAAELHAGGWDVAEDTVLQLQGDDTGNPVFCVCGVHVYQQLADALGPDRPVYGMFLPVERELFADLGGNGHGSTKITVEQLASAYIEAMREKQPVGPYQIVGFCFGGIVAYEMAQQLKASGEAGPLILLESLLGGAVKLPWARKKARRTRRWARRHVRLTINAVNRRLGRPVNEPSEMDRLRGFRREIFSGAARHYRFSAYPGPALLVQAEATLNDPTKRLVDRTFGWGKHVDRLEIFEASGSHETHLRRPNVDAVASRVRQFLEANGPTES